MLEKGQTAPGFGLTDSFGEIFHLSEYRGEKNLVLYFYPKDDTSGCTIEASDFTRLKDQFAALDTVVLGISRDDQESHQCFIKKFNLQITLLSDVDGLVCEKYQVWQNKGSDSEPKMGIVRSTFIIDRQGKLAEVMYQVKADGHAEQVLQLVRALTQNS